MLIRNYAGKVVVQGGSVCVYGAGFSGSTKAWFGDSEAVVYDYDDGFIQVMAPKTVGILKLYVGDSGANRKFVGKVDVTDDTKRLALDNVADHPESDFEQNVCQSLLGLLPRGFAWYKGSDGLFSRLMLGIAGAVVELYRLIAAYRTNVSPTHTDSVTDFESEFRLPEEGVEYEGGDSEQSKKRLLEVYRKACKKGGCTIPYFKSVAALFDIDVEIYEYWKNPERFDGVQDTPERLNFYWMIKQNIPLSDVKFFDCQTECNKPLRWWEKAAFEKLINASIPSHTRCLYAYGEKG